MAKKQIYAIVLLLTLLVACGMRNKDGSVTPVPFQVVEATRNNNDQVYPSPTTKQSDPEATQSFDNKSQEWLHENSYLLKQAGRTSDQHLLLYPPGEIEGIRILDGCLISSSSVSHGRVAVIVGVEPKSSDCRFPKISDMVLYTIELNDLKTERIVSIIESIEGIEFEELEETDLRFRVSSAVSMEVPEWSPDGRHLAFVAAVQEINSDVYSYDLENKTIRRMTSNPEHSSSPRWPEDGSGVISLEAFPSADPFMSILGVWWTSLNGVVANWSGPNLWPGSFINVYPLSSNSWLAWGFNNNTRKGPFYRINTQSQVAQQVCPDAYSLGYLHHENHDFVISYCSVDSAVPLSPSLFTFLDGLYIGKKVLSDLAESFPMYGSIQSLEEPQVFILDHEEKGLITISPDGVFSILDQEVASRRLQVSPNKKWLAVSRYIDRGEVGDFELYSVSSSGLTLTWSGEHRIHPLWSPESSMIVLDCSDSSSTVLHLSDLTVNIYSECPEWMNWGNRYNSSWWWNDIDFVIYPIQNVNNQP